MHRITFNQGQVVEERKSVGSEMVTKDGEGKEIGRRPLTEEEVAQIAAKEQPSPDETLVAELEAASTVADLKAALVRRFRG